MAITEKELKAAIAKLQERNTLAAKPTERISVAEWKSMQGGSSDAVRLEEESKKVQERVAESVSKTDGDGLNANAKKTYDQMKKQTEGITQLVKQSKEQSDAIASLAENTELTRGPIEKMVSFMSNMREKLSPKNIKETVLTKAASTFGGIPLVGGMIKKAAEKESWIKTQMKIDPTADRKQLSKDWGSFREAHKETRAASAEYEKTRKMFGMSDSQFAKTPEGKRLLSQQVEATTKLAKYDRRANLIANEGESETRETPNREPKTKDEERLIEKLKPETGQEVTFDKQQYRFLGQQWAEVGGDGKTGRMAERGIVKELNRLAGVDPAVNATRKEAGDTGALDNLRKAEDYSDDQIELLRKIEENTRPTQVSGGAKARSLPVKGKEVTFSGQKYRFQGQQWVEVNEKTGKQGRIAERGIVGELNKRAGVTAANAGRKPEKSAPKVGFLDKIEKFGNSMVGAAKGIAAMGGSLLVLTLGLKAISTIDFESIAKATLAVGGLVLVSKLMGDNVGSMLKGALGIAALGGAMMLAAEGFKSFASLDWETLGKAGVAIAALAVGVAAIGAFIAPILAGVAALVAMGAAVWVLSKGVDALAGAVERIQSPKSTTTPAPQSANAVYGASAENAQSATVSNAGTTNNVVAPTTVNNTNNQVGGYKPDVRNQDSSFKRMLDSRYVPV